MPRLTNNNSNYLNIWIFTALLLGGFALYFIPLQSTSFYYDDHISIKNNDVIKTIDIPRIFNAFNTRFLVGLSFALNYKWCALHPAGYRLINLLIHCLNAFLVYLLVKATLYCHPGRSEGSKGVLRIFPTPRMTNNLEWPAFFASLLFLCHPIQTEPVNFITQRFVLMGTFFYLASLVLYIKSRKMATSPGRRLFYTGSLITATAAMFCKEFVVTLPFMITLYEFYFLNSFKETIWERCRRLIPFFIIILIVPLLLLRTPPEVVLVADIAGSDSIHHIDITRARNGIDRKKYFLTELNVMRTYVRLLFLPVNQNLDYDYPQSRTIDYKTVMSGLFLLCLLALAAITCKSYRIISFGILWFFIALSVESSFIPIGHVIAEYRVYLASVGFVFLVMDLIFMHRVHQKQLNIFAACILIVFSMLTYQRNKVWKDEITLWNDTIEKSPYKSRPYYSRGFAYSLQSNFNQAVFDYNKAIELNPDFAKSYNNRGWAYYKLGKLPQAIIDYNKALQKDPHFAKAYYNRGLVYYLQGELAQAISDFTKVITIDPNHAEIYYNRGLAYNDQGKLFQAIADYNKAIEINPHFVMAYNNRGWAYQNQGKWTQALSDYNKAIAIDPDFALACINRDIVTKRINLLNNASDNKK